MKNVLECTVLTFEATERQDLVLGAFWFLVVPRVLTGIREATDTEFPQIHVIDSKEFQENLILGHFWCEYFL